MLVEGTVALVTGANRGIGRALVDALLDRGAVKVYAGARDPETVKVTDGRVVPLRLDVTSSEQVAAAAREASDVSLLINNAGAGTGTGVLDGSLDAVREVMDVNVFGTWAMARAFAPVLAANQGGVMVNMLSVASWLAMEAAPGYSASKAAQWSLSNALRLALRAQGTSVMNVHCGYVDTDFSTQVPLQKITPETVAREILLGLANNAEEVLVDDVAKAVKAALPDDLRSLYTVSHAEVIAMRPGH